MSVAVSAAEANRYFSKLLRDVRGGASCVITSHGKPVARLVPVSSADGAREVSREALLSRLRTQATTGPAGTWTRDELYDE